MNVVVYVADFTNKLASVMEVVDRGNCVIFNKQGGYIQTMKEEDELNLSTLMDTLKGARVRIARKGNNFVVEIMVQHEDAKKDGEYTVSRKAATKSWNSMKKMDVDEGKLQLKNRYGALSLGGEEAYGANAGSFFAGQGQGM